MNARYSIKILKIPNNLHTYVHNNLKQRTNKEGGTFSWAQGRKIPKYGPCHSQSYDSMYFQVRGTHKVRGIYTTSS
jgi:hypothetical protein